MEARLGPKERREREREEIRTAILDAARELFASDGYEAVTMRRIAEKIEYSPTAIYFHFRDKDALVRALCDHDFLQLAQQFAEVATIEDPLEKLTRTGMAYLRFGLEYPNHYRLMFMTPHPPLSPEESEVKHGNPEEDAYAFLKSIVDEAIAKGIFHESDAELVSQIVWAGVHGVISLQIAKCNDAWIDWRPLEQRSAFMIRTLIAGLAKE
ncbi:MAG TPA: TetR/AcrR family transcriptional regulator [Thermoanaerobaculia bacterium]|nr:TetR/AcrR family transcriptional regulator [Thermoanaerobaculia bacterium]